MWVTGVFINQESTLPYGWQIEDSTLVGPHVPHLLGHICIYIYLICNIYLSIICIQATFSRGVFVGGESSQNHNHTQVPSPRCSCEGVCVCVCVCLDPRGWAKWSPTRWIRLEPLSQSGGLQPCPQKVVRLPGTLPNHLRNGGRPGALQIRMFWCMLASQVRLRSLRYVL